MAERNISKRAMKSYSELVSFSSFEERFEYLRLSGAVGDDTFGGRRWLNQHFYRSREWKNFRNDIIARDCGCDLAIMDRPILGRAYVHHINPITPEDLVNRSRKVLDPENAILVSFDTHNAIHYGSLNSIVRDLVERAPNDTCPWKEETWQSQPGT